MRLLMVLERHREGRDMIMIVNEGGKINKEEGMEEERWVWSGGVTIPSYGWCPSCPPRLQE
jgi:hypothetical protein